ncbi:hypothetical protein ScPMuIL_009468 [Solemya velum]
MMLPVFVTALCVILSSGQRTRQRQPPGPVQIPQCIQTGRLSNNQCFVGAGHQITSVDGVLTNGTMQPMPQNANEIRSDLCRKSTQIIPCVLASLNSLRGKEPCLNQDQFWRLESELVDRLTAYNAMCGVGATPPSQCMADMTQNMQQCYIKSGLDPSMYAPARSNLRGAILGSTKEIAGRFCGVRKELFECMDQVIQACDGARDFMTLSGYDHTSMIKGMEVLCEDSEVYISGLMCFQRPSTSVQECMRQSNGKMLDLRTEQLGQAMSMERFYEKFCQIRVEQLRCDMQAWGPICEESAVGLKNEFECRTLPNHCQRLQSVQGDLMDTCSEPNFARHLRSGSASVSTSLITSLISAVAVFTLMLI